MLYTDQPRFAKYYESDLLLIQRSVAVARGRKILPREFHKSSPPPPPPSGYITVLLFLPAHRKNIISTHSDSAQDYVVNLLGERVANSRRRRGRRRVSPREEINREGKKSLCRNKLSHPVNQINMLITGGSFEIICSALCSDLVA